MSIYYCRTLKKRKKKRKRNHKNKSKNSTHIGSFFFRSKIRISVYGTKRLRFFVFYFMHVILLSITDFTLICLWCLIADRTYSRRLDYIHPFINMYENWKPSVGKAKWKKNLSFSVEFFFSFSSVSPWCYFSFGPMCNDVLECWTTLFHYFFFFTILYCR